MLKSLLDRLPTPHVNQHVCYPLIVQRMQQEICVDFLPQSNYPHFFTFLQARSMSNSTFMTSHIQPFTVLILAGGHGARMNTDIPKQYQDLCGQPIICHAIKNFLKHPLLKQVHIVIDPAHQSLYEEATRHLDLPSPIHGGKTRMESCYNGLNALNLNENDLILIHDAARPNVSIQDIDHVLNALNAYKSVSLGLPLSETLRRSDDKNILHESIDRTNVWALKTPQGFHYQDLKTAHEKELAHQ